MIMKKSTILTAAVVLLSIMGGVYLAADTAPEQSLTPTAQMAEIVGVSGCADCHTAEPSLPFYAEFPVAGDLVKKDAADGYRAFDVQPMMHALADDSKVSEVDLAKVEISQLVPKDEPKSVKVEKTISAVCDKYNISKETIVGKRRNANIVMARHVCMYSLREAIDMTYKDIGKVFSCDHTSVMAAIKKIEAEKEKSNEFKEEIAQLIKDIRDSLY